MIGNGAAHCRDRRGAEGPARLHPHRQFRGAWDQVAIPQPREWLLDSPVTDCSKRLCDLESSRAECRPARDGGTQQLLRPRAGRKLACAPVRRPRPPRRSDRRAAGAPTCASDMLNLICGASNERVAAVYPASAMDTASPVRPASAAIVASAHAISAPTTGGSASITKFFDASNAACGSSMANQYTVRKASI